MGRPITDEDNANRRPVAVINEAFAKRFFGKENPIGQHFGPAPRKNAGMYEIVGVASDVRYFSWNVWHPERPMYFPPEAQTTHFDGTVRASVWERRKLPGISHGPTECGRLNFLAWRQGYAALFVSLRPVSDRSSSSLRAS
jgi:MacB-like periplasmic core domain